MNKKAKPICKKCGSIMKYRYEKRSTCDPEHYECFNCGNKFYGTRDNDTGHLTIADMETWRKL